MIMIVSISHIFIMKWWWSMYLYFIFISSNYDDQYVQLVISQIHTKQWSFSMRLHLISISNNDVDQCVSILSNFDDLCAYIIISISNYDDDQCVYIFYPYQAMMMINVSISYIYIMPWWWSMYLYFNCLSEVEESKVVYNNWPQMVLP
jgi:hypothetical protein